MSNFAVYNSSAGSGKTFTLVKEYLKIALKTNKSDTYKHILAITFTNKAASEMKERILSALKFISGNEVLKDTPKYLLEALKNPIDKGGLGLDEKIIKERCQKVLKSILHHYNDFGVSTIDKFTHKIIRTFAHDLHLPLNFEVEIDQNELLKKVIDQLIDKVGKDEKLTKLLVEYANNKADDEKNWNIEKDLFDFTSKITNENNRHYIKKIRDLTLDDFEHIKSYIFQFNKTFEQEMIEIGTKTLQFLNENNIEIKSFSNSFYPTYFNNLSKKNIKSPNDTLKGIIAGEKNWYSKTTESTQKQLIDAHKNQLIDFYDEVEKLKDEKYSQYKLNQLIYQNLYNLGIVNEIENTIFEFKKENNVLSIADFNTRISGIVSSEPVPFIYERLGEKYQHFLIDEFQDTSIIQWHNLLPLLENSLANGNFNMIVGDAKQAIYRFRGGEVEQIIRLPQVFKHQNNPILLEREKSLQRNFKPEILSENFRSKAEIVNFNNQFFNKISTKLNEDYL